MFATDLKSIFLFLLAATICCSLINYILTLFLFRRELSAFLKGREIKTKHKVHLSFNSIPFRKTEMEGVLHCLEEKFIKLNFIWRKKDYVYCGFRGFFFSCRLKCMVKRIELSKDSFILEFNYFDRFYNPIVSEIAKDKFIGEIEKLYNKMNIDGNCSQAGEGMGMGTPLTY